jgi:hypothetical protein
MIGECDLVFEEQYELQLHQIIVENSPKISLYYGSYRRVELQFGCDELSLGSQDISILQHELLDSSQVQLDEF